MECFSVRDGKRYGPYLRYGYKTAVVLDDRIVPIFEYFMPKSPILNAVVPPHDMGVCAEKHKEEMEAMLTQATKRLGW